MSGGYIKFLRSGAYGDRVLALETDGQRWRWWLLVVNADRKVFPGLLSNGTLRPFDDLSIITQVYASKEYKTINEKLEAWKADKQAFLTVGLLKNAKVLGQEYLWNVDWHTYQDKYSPKRKSTTQRFFKSWMELKEKEQLLFLYLVYQFRPTGVMDVFEDDYLMHRVISLIEGQDSKYALLGLLRDDAGVKKLRNGLSRLTERVGMALGATQKKANPDVREAISYFRDAYRKRVGKQYLVRWEKDGAIMAKLLQACTLVELKGLIDRFMMDNDEFVVKAGRSVGIFSMQFNRLQSAKGNAEIDYSNY